MKRKKLIKIYISLTVFTEEELENLLDRNDLLEQQPSTSESGLKKPLGTSTLENSQ